MSGRRRSSETGGPAKPESARRLRASGWRPAVSVVLSLLLGCGQGEGPSAASSAAAAATASASTTAALAPEAAALTLRFAREGRDVAVRSLAELSGGESTVVEVFDPYYKRAKRFRAVPLARVMEAGFAGVGVPLAEQEYLFRAKDGYTVPMRGDQAFEAGGFVAFEDVDVPGWEPIGPQRANPAPFYLVWTEPNQGAESHPRPWQLATIEMTRFEVAFPHLAPGDLPAEHPASRGLGLFRKHCVLCHAINREGGRVGPELNVPQSIVEYRPEEQIKAYIKNPLTFRYGAMPAHPNLSDEDLSDLVAYFHAMKDHKHDPDAHPEGGE